MMRRFLCVAAVAVAYLVAARVGLFWGVLPDYSASLIWPASGLAAAASLEFGRKALLGILLGALVAYGIEGLEYASFWAWFNVVFISLASVLSAYIASTWLQANASLVTLWRNASDILADNLAIAAAAAVPAVCALIAQMFVPQVSRGDLAAYFSIWWLSNYLGMIVFGPVFWVLIRWARTGWKSNLLRRLYTPLAITSASGMIALMAFMLLFNLEKNDVRAQLSRGAASTASGLSQALDRAARKLGSIRALIYASENVNEEEFRRFTEVEMGAHLEAPGVQAVGWAPKVTDPNVWAAKVNGNVKHVRSVWQRDSSGANIPVSSRNAYFPVHYIQPLNEVNQRAIGFDLASERTRRRALERARDTGEASIAAPIILVQSSQPVPAMLMAVPIYTPDVILDSIAARRESLSGFASGVYLVRDIFDNSTIVGDTNIDVHLFDESMTAENQWIHSQISNVTSAVSEGDVTPSLDHLKKEVHGIAHLDFGGHRWTIIATPTSAASPVRPSWISWATLFLLLLLGALTSTIYIERASARESSRREKKMTEAALAAAQAANESKAYFMAAASHDIKQPLYALSMLIDTLMMSNTSDSSAPVLKRLSSSIRQLSSHFDTLMDMEVFRDGNFENKAVLLSLAEFAPRVDIEFAPLCADNNIEWILEMDDVAVMTDPELLLRLLRNILANALRHSGASQVSCRAKHADDDVVFTVHDTGKGLTPIEQGLIRQKLREPDLGGNGSIDGGLGLTIVARIAQALALEIDIEAIPGKGTTFTFSLPLAD